MSYALSCAWQRLLVWWEEMKVKYRRVYASNVHNMNLWLHPRMGALMSKQWNELQGKRHYGTIPVLQALNDSNTKQMGHFEVLQLFNNRWWISKQESSHQNWEDANILKNVLSGSREVSEIYSAVVECIARYIYTYVYAPCAYDVTTNQIYSSWMIDWVKPILLVMLQCVVAEVAVKHDRAAPFLDDKCTKYFNAQYTLKCTHMTNS